MGYDGTVLFGSVQGDYGTVKYLRRPRFVSFGSQGTAWRSINFGYIFPPSPAPGQSMSTVKVWLSLASPSEQDFEADEVLDVSFVFPLTTSLDPSGPAEFSVEPGEMNVEVARYRLSAMDNNIQVNNLAVQVVSDRGGCDFQNLRLMAGNAQIGVTIAAPAMGCMAVFDNLGLMVSARNSGSVRLVLDVASTASPGDAFSANLVGVGVGVPVAGLSVQGRRISICIPGEPCMVFLPDPIY